MTTQSSLLRFVFPTLGGFILWALFIRAFLKTGDLLFAVRQSGHLNPKVQWATWGLVVISGLWTLFLGAMLSWLVWATLTT